MMSFGSFDEHEDMPMAEINVTPLVDVMLVLLIVFMITMPVLTHTLPLQLPVTSNEKEQKVDPKEPFRVEITAEGQYAVRGENVSLSRLGELFISSKKDNEDVILAIAADKSVAYEKVTDVLGVAQEAGIEKVGFVTEQE